MENSSDLYNVEVKRTREKNLSGSCAKSGKNKKKLKLWTFVSFVSEFK